MVWYRKRDGDRATGPGKVVFQDGKVIFVKHGRLYITTSPTRLLKANKVFEKFGEEIDKLGPEIEPKCQDNLANDASKTEVIES